MTFRSAKESTGWATRKALTGAMLSGWAVNSIVTLQDGFPFTPQLSYNPSNDGDTQAIRSGHSSIPTSLQPDVPAMPRTPNEWFNPAAFCRFSRQQWLLRKPWPEHA